MTLSLRLPLICVLAPVVLWPQTFSGTTGVAIAIPGLAVVAIDSRVTLGTGADARRGPDECKLKAFGRYFVAIAGMYDHGDTKFDAWRLAEEAVAGAPSVSAAAALAERRIEPELATALFNIQAADPADFARQFSRAHLAFVVAGMERGAPALAGREFLPNGNAAIRVVRWEPSLERTSVFVFGTHSAIGEVYRGAAALIDLVGSRGPAEAARSLVELEIAREPTSVGPPVSILQFTEDGPIWIDCGLCGLGTAKPLR